MSSAARTITDMTCDRCGMTQACEEGLDQFWGTVIAQTRGGGSVVSAPGGYRADLCTICVGSLRDWYAEKVPLKRETSIPYSPPYDRSKDPTCAGGNGGY